MYLVGHGHHGRVLNGRVMYSGLQFCKLTNDRMSVNWGQGDWLGSCYSSLRWQSGYSDNSGHGRGGDP